MVYRLWGLVYVRKLAKITLPEKFLIQTFFFLNITYCVPEQVPIQQDQNCQTRGKNWLFSCVNPYWQPHKFLSCQQSYTLVQPSNSLVNSADDGRFRWICHFSSKYHAFLSTVSSEKIQEKQISLQILQQSFAGWRETTLLLNISTHPVSLWFFYYVQKI